MIAAATDLRVHDVGSGPTVVLVHGWMCDRHDLTAVSDLLARDHRVLTVDLRGHGDNSDVEGGFTVQDFAADLAEIVLTRVGAPAVVCGHSMGAAVAVELARQHPERVAGVVAVDGPWVFSVPDRATLLPAGHLTSEEHDGRGGRILDARRRLHGPDVAMGVPRHEVAAASFESLMSWDGPGTVAAVRCPIVALATESSIDTTRGGAVNHPHVHVTAVPGSGHWIQVERPDAVAAHVRELVSEVLR